MPETVPCGLCGSADATFQERRTRLTQMPGPYEIKKCKACGFEYLSPRPTSDELRDRYVGHPWFGPEALVSRPRRRRFDRERFRRLERWTDGPGSLLAIGALEGGWAMDNARLRGWDVVGVEFIPSLLASEATKTVEMINSPMWDVDVLNGRRFDAIHTLSLEHVPDVLGTLSQFRRLLKPGGVLVVEAPNQFEALKEQFKLVLLDAFGERVLPQFQALPHYQADAAPYFHVSYFTPRTLRDALTRSGFEILESRSYLPWNPTFHQTRPWLRTVREAIFLIGGLVERGPSVEVMARRA